MKFVRVCKRYNKIIAFSYFFTLYILHLSVIFLFMFSFLGRWYGYVSQEFNDLVGKKFVFKVDITSYNIDKTSFMYPIFKLTNDEHIMMELENKYPVDNVFYLTSYPKLFIYIISSLIIYLSVYWYPFKWYSTFNVSIF